MANPWDPFPFPTHGDSDDRITYEGVGRVLSQWEAIEFRLAQIYSVFVGDPNGDALKRYGAGRIFRDRFTALQTASEPYFIKRPNQELEAQLKCLGNAATGFADRRNDVAHGMVYPVNELTSFTDRFGSSPNTPQHALIPPLYLARKHGADGLPTYAYCYAELRSLEARLIILVDQMGQFFRALQRA